MIPITPDMKVCLTCNRSLKNTKFHRTSKDCNTCRGRKDRIKGASSSTYKVKQKAARLKYSNTIRGKLKLRELHIKSRYDISAKEYEQKYTNQQGECAICSKPLSMYKGHTEHLLE